MRRRRSAAAAGRRSRLLLLRGGRRSSSRLSCSGRLGDARPTARHIALHGRGKKKAEKKKLSQHFKFCRRVFFAATGKS